MYDSELLAEYGMCVIFIIYGLVFLIKALKDDE